MKTFKKHIQNTVRRLFVEKRQGFKIEESHLLKELKENLHLDNLDSTRILNYYESGMFDYCIFAPLQI